MVDKQQPDYEAILEWNMTDYKGQKIGAELINPSKSFKSIGNNVVISPHATFYGAENISIGDNVRVDDFTVISAVGGFIEIGSNIHISTHCLLIGSGGIILEDYVNIASGCVLMSASDDFSGAHLIGPCVPDEKRMVKKGIISMHSHAVLGIRCTLLPGAALREGCAFGAGTLGVGNIYKGWSVYVGSPAKMIKQRSSGSLSLVSE